MLIGQAAVVVIEVASFEYRYNDDESTQSEDSGDVDGTGDDGRTPDERSRSPSRTTPQHWTLSTSTNNGRSHCPPTNAVCCF